MPEKTDVCVIGSGFGGSISAYRLAKAGKKVVVLERGAYLKGEDYVQTLDFAKQKGVLRVLMGPGSAWLAANCVGGGSVVYSMASLRAPSMIFARRDANGNRLWPEELTRKTMDPWYDLVEKNIGVTHLKWNQVTKHGGIWAKACDAAGYTCDPVPVAATDCLDCGWCNVGCKWDRKNSMILNYLAWAERLGTEVRPLREVLTIAPNPTGKGYIVTYRKLDSWLQEVDTIQANIVVVAAGALFTPQILLRSLPFLPQMSRHVGKHLSGNGDKIFFAVFPGDYHEGDSLETQWENNVTDFYKGKVISTMTYEFLEEGFTIQDINYPPSLAFLFGRPAESPSYWGLSHKHWTRRFGRHTLGLAVFLAGETGDGEVLPAPVSGSLTSLGPLEVAPITYNPSETTKALWNRATQRAREIVASLGGELMEVTATSYAASAHPLGSCRMGRTADDSAVDVHGELHHYPGIFVTDGSAIPTSLAVNPSLTIAANCERICDWLTQNLDRYF
jgi:choline dehydrogenase-like flavoprotein